MSSERTPAEVTTEWSTPTPDGPPERLCGRCGAVLPTTVSPDGQTVDWCERCEEAKSDAGRARDRQHAEATHALRLAYYDLAVAQLYQKEQPPTPFDLAVVGYAADPTKATLKLVDGVWTVTFDRNQPPLVREIDPDIAARLAYRVVYTDGAETRTTPYGVITAYQLPGDTRADHLAKTYARERPDVGIWVVIEAEHADTVSTLRGWVITWHEPPHESAPGEHFRVSGTGSIATATPREGTWADLFPPPTPPGALAQHPGPWRDGRAPILSAMPFQIVRSAMLATSHTSEWATVDNVAVYRKEDAQHGQHVAIQRRCDGANPDAIFSELAAVAGDGVADTYAAVLARIIEAGAPAEGIWLNVSDVLHDRDLQPIRKRPGGPSTGYRTEDRLTVGEHFDELKRWHITGQLASWQGGKRGKKRPPMNIHSDFLTYTDMVTQTALDGREIPVAVRVVLGEYARHYLANGAGRQTAMLMRQALKYDPHNEQIEKRLAYHLAFYWRMAARERNYEQPMNLRELFRDARIETDGLTQARNTQRTIDRWLRAFDALKRDDVIVGYELLPGPDDTARSNLDRWLNQRIRFTPPTWATSHYFDIGKSNPRLKATPEQTLQQRP